MRSRLTGITALVIALAVAAGIHFGVAIQHRGAGHHGVFFAAAGTVQLLLAVAVRRRPSHGALALAALASVALVAVWAITRLPGLTDRPQRIGAADLTATALALGAAALAVGGLRGAGTARPGAVRAIPGLALVAAVGLTTATTAIGPTDHGTHHHDHTEAPARDHAQDRGPGHGHATDPHPPEAIFGELFEDHHGHEPGAHDDTDHEPRPPAASRTRLAPGPDGPPTQRAPRPGWA